MNISRYIPNTITSMNLLCGTRGVICVFNGRPEYAFPFMLAAAVFDFLDGMAARALDARSDMGKELDSLADLIIFGLLPSMMLHQLMKDLSPQAGLLCYMPLAITVFSALRLARFNVDDRQSDNFIGLATPACAMICASLSYYILQDPDSFLTRWAHGKVFIPLLSIILSALLVSDIPMFSMKIKRGAQKNTPIYRLRVAFMGVICVSAVLTWLLGLNWSMAVLLIFVTYIIMNIIHCLTYRQETSRIRNSSRES